MKLVDIMIKAGFAKTKSEARRLIEGGGVRLNDEKVFDVNAEVINVDGVLWIIKDEHRESST